jgi:hypothetical protein
MVRVPLAMKELTEIRVRDEENIGMGYLVQGKAKATRFNHKITWHISSQNPAQSSIQDPSIPTKTNFRSQFMHT